MNSETSFMLFSVNFIEKERIWQKKIIEKENIALRIYSRSSILPLQISVEITIITFLADYIDGNLGSMHIFIWSITLFYIVIISYNYLLY